MENKVNTIVNNLMKITKGVPPNELMWESFGRDVAHEIGEPLKNIAELQIHVAAASLNGDWSQVILTVTEIVWRQKTLALKRLHEAFVAYTSEFESDGIMILDENISKRTNNSKLIRISNEFHKTWLETLRSTDKPDRPIFDKKMDTFSE